MQSNEAQQPPQAPVVPTPPPVSAPVQPQAQVQSQPAAPQAPAQQQVPQESSQVQQRVHPQSAMQNYKTTTDASLAQMQTVANQFGEVPQGIVPPRQPNPYVQPEPHPQYSAQAYSAPYNAPYVEKTYNPHNYSHPQHYTQPSYNPNPMGNVPSARHTYPQSNQEYEYGATPPSPYTPMYEQQNAPVQRVQYSEPNSVQRFQQTAHISTPINADPPVLVQPQNTVTAPVNFPEIERMTPSELGKLYASLMKERDKRERAAYTRNEFGYSA